MSLQILPTNLSNQNYLPDQIVTFDYSKTPRLQDPAFCEEFLRDKFGLTLEYPSQAKDILRHIVQKSLPHLIHFITRDEDLNLLATFDPSSNLGQRFYISEIQRCFKPISDEQRAMHQKLLIAEYTPHLKMKYQQLTRGGALYQKNPQEAEIFLEEAVNRNFPWACKIKYKKLIMNYKNAPSNQLALEFKSQAKFFLTQYFLDEHKWAFKYKIEILIEKFKKAKKNSNNKDEDAYDKIRQKLIFLIDSNLENPRLPCSKAKYLLLLNTKPKLFPESQKAQDFLESQVAQGRNWAIKLYMSQLIQQQTTPQILFNFLERWVSQGNISAITRLLVCRFLDTPLLNIDADIEYRNSFMALIREKYGTVSQIKDGIRELAQMSE